MVANVVMQDQNGYVLFLTNSTFNKLVQLYVHI